MKILFYLVFVFLLPETCYCQIDSQRILLLKKIILKDTEIDSIISIKFKMSKKYDLILNDTFFCIPPLNLNSFINDDLSKISSKDKYIISTKKNKLYFYIKILSYSCDLNSIIAVLYPLDYRKLKNNTLSEGNIRIFFRFADKEYSKIKLEFTYY